MAGPPDEVSGSSARGDPVRRWRRSVHLWVPACLSGLLLVVFFPLILRLQPDSFQAATGRSPDPYLGRWLLISAGLFVASGLGYLVGAIRRRAHGHAQS